LLDTVPIVVKRLLGVLDELEPFFLFTLRNTVWLGQNA